MTIDGVPAGGPAMIHGHGTSSSMTPTHCSSATQRAEEPVNHRRDGTLARRAMWPQPRERKHDEREQHGANAEHDETQSGMTRRQVGLKPSVMQLHCQLACVHDDATRCARGEASAAMPRFARESFGSIGRAGASATAMPDRTHSSMPVPGSPTPACVEQDRKRTALHFIFDRAPGGVGRLVGVHDPAPATTDPSVLGVCFEQRLAERFRARGNRTGRRPVAACNTEDAGHRIHHGQAECGRRNGLASVDRAKNIGGAAQFAVSRREHNAHAVALCGAIMRHL